MAELPPVVYFIGTAGAGKSTLVAAYDRWARRHAMTTTLVNLDPGAEAMPYEPDVDVRDYLDLASVMEEHGLGPNGAQIAAADLLAVEHLEDLQEEIGSYRSDLILIDTPGQMELFVFREAGRHIMQALDPARSVLVHLLDPFLARTASGFASQLLLSANTRVRFAQPMIPVLSKADILTEDDTEHIATWAADPDALESDVLAATPGLDQEFATQVTRLLAAMEMESQLIAASSADERGLEDLYAAIQAVAGGAEDATPEYDTFLGPDQDDIT